MNLEKRRLLIHHSLETEEQNNLKLLQKIRMRMQKVRVAMPHLEVRFQNLIAEANVSVGNAGMPTFVNFFLGAAMDAISSTGLIKGGRQKLSILGDSKAGISGVLKPVSFKLGLGTQQ